MKQFNEASFLSERIKQNMKIIGVIPSRYGSSRLAGKPLVDLCGQTMIERVYRCSKRSKLLESVIVATDDERIYNEIKRFGGDVEMTSPNHQTGTDRIVEVAQKRGFADEDVVVNIQGDQPLIDAKTIDNLIRPLAEDKSLVMSTMSYRITDPADINNPACVKVITDCNGMAIYFSRLAIPYVRDPQGVDLLQVPYYKHLGLYAYRKKFLVQYSSLKPSHLEKYEKLEQLRALENGYGIKVVESQFDSAEINEPEDVEKLRALIRGMK
jgi:3-deoxy-manno-octulosonate cytidylyltransferase (CMP-KDO synthetase)